MNPLLLSADDFPAFFRELWGADCDPFPWQREFARRLCSGQIPDYVAVPTGCGKTACLDAAVFALAVQSALPMAERHQGRRIFFIVNRRIIVDEAYNRAGMLCTKLEGASPESMAGRAATALRRLSGEPGALPLFRVQLRGGIYRDRNWAKSLLQPMIICSTVDQAGSRLLFRGYGVSPQARPIHAAMVAQDSLLIIDEAHISRPFVQTLEWVKLYRLHQPVGGETVHLPFQLIQMTATPPADVRHDQTITLSPEDHEHPVLKPRLSGTKPTRLVIEPKAKGKAREEQMARRLVEEAETIITENHPQSIAIMVNRVATARSVAAKMEEDHKGCVTLLIGRLRPLDRESATKTIQDRLKTGATVSASETGLSIVVSTQCLEVGADLDFDTLITEAASLDALRQRFGRLNRGGRNIDAHAVIVLPADQDLALDKLDEAAPCDPIYGNAIPRTWLWLSGLAQDGKVDFGINAMTVAVGSFRAAEGYAALAALLSPTSDAPVLLSAYLDCWAQTNPAPAADPDIALFLHGPKRDMADVQVCWRGDLPESSNKDEWSDILSLCPPTTAECLPVPLHVVREWVASDGKFEDSSSDVVETQQLHDTNKNEAGRGGVAFIWRGLDDSLFAVDSTDLRPGDTVVIRVQSGGWQALGHLPGAPDDPQVFPDKVLTYEEILRVDVAERAAATARRCAILRIHPALWPKPDEGTAGAKLRRMALDPEKDWPIVEIKGLLTQLLADEDSGWALSRDQKEGLEHLTKNGVRLDVEPYPRDQGFALTSRDPLSKLDAGDSGEPGDSDSDALLESPRPQELCTHTRGVLAEIEKTLSLLPMSRWGEALIAAATAHDWGKIDPRFQAMLRGTTPFGAMASEVFLAKSGSISSSAAARRATRLRAELPEGFRHEMLSVQMAENTVGATVLPTLPVLHALSLHLIATHHGYARPFAPLVQDDAPLEVNLPMNAKNIIVTGEERLECPAHSLNSGLTERFWQMNHHYGWWGIALLDLKQARFIDRTARIAVF